MKLTIQEQIYAIKGRNELLTGRIYSHYRSEFLAFIRKRLLADPDLALEVYQDAFMVMCNKIFEDKITLETLSSGLKTYLFGIGIKITCNLNRKLGKYHIQEIGDFPDIPLDEPVLGEENEKIIQKAVHDLGEPCHTILVKQYWENKSGEEIVAEMSYKNKDAAKTQKYKCMQRLKNELKGKIMYQS